MDRRPAAWAGECYHCAAQHGTCSVRKVRHVARADDCGFASPAGAEGRAVHGCRHCSRVLAPAPIVRCLCATHGALWRRAVGGGLAGQPSGVGAVERSSDDDGSLGTDRSLAVGWHLGDALRTF